MSSNKNEKKFVKLLTNKNVKYIIRPNKNFSDFRRSFYYDNNITYKKYWNYR